MLAACNICFLKTIYSIEVQKYINGLKKPKAFNEGIDSVNANKSISK